jgi:hypothetical protein
MDTRIPSTDTISNELQRRLDEMTERLDRLEEQLPPIPARALGLSRATAHRVNSTASAIVNDVSRQVGRFSSTAQDALSTTAGQTRSAVERTTQTAQHTGSEATGQARAQARRVTSTAQSAVSTTVGQTRSAVERTARTAKNTGAEATGQARAQARRTAKQAQRSSTALLDDATRAVEPSDDGRPASLDDWTKTQLYERAQELDLDGRSSMSKKQLIRGLRDA